MQKDTAMQKNRRNCKPKKNLYKQLSRPDKNTCAAAHSHGPEKLISAIHSNCRKEIFGEEFYVPDDSKTAKARASLDETSAASLTALGDALVFQMRYREAIDCFIKALSLSPESCDLHRKLGARYMSTLQTDKAEAEFLLCEKSTDDLLDIKYRLALCAFYRKNYSLAKQHFAECYPYCENNGEMLIAVIYWEIICSVKLGEDVSAALSRYSENINCGHHLGYKFAVKLFIDNDVTNLYETENDTELGLTLYLFGLYHYQIYKKSFADANKTLKYMLSLDTYFSSFVYLAALCETGMRLPLNF